MFVLRYLFEDELVIDTTGLINLEEALRMDTTDRNLEITIMIRDTQLNLGHGNRFG